MSDYRCRDMEQACNHAGHIDALEQLVDTQADRIAELEAEVERLQGDLEEAQEAERTSLGISHAAIDDFAKANATLERVRAALNVKSYDTDPYSDVRVVDVEDVREALAPTNAEGGET